MHPFPPFTPIPIGRNALFWSPPLPESSSVKTFLLEASGASLYKSGMKRILLIALLCALAGCATKSRDYVGSGTKPVNERMIGEYGGIKTYGR